jgi:hypothetical protein
VISKKWLYLVISGFFGFILQLSAFVLFLSSTGNEVFFVISILLYYAGSCCMMIGFECRIKQENIRRPAVFLAFAGIIGFIIFLLIKPKNTAARDVYKESEKKPTLFDRIVAICFLILAVISFVWVVTKWPQDTEQTGKVFSRIIQANEAATYRTIKQIIRAQDEYYEKDHNQDGKLEYAKFPVHLWTTVDKEARPLYLGLVPRDVGCAMGPSLAVNGYYFNCLHIRECEPGCAGSKELSRYYGYENLEEIDYTSGWVLTAQPAQYGKSGKISFIVYSPGQVWARDLMQEQIIKWYPLSPTKEGWKLIGDEEDISDL